MISNNGAKPLYVLTLISSILTFFATVVGLTHLGLYTPTTPERLIPGTVSQDILSLLTAAGLLLCLVAIQRGSGRSWLIWLGLEGYLLYAYGLYSFERVYNPIYLIYIAIFSLSLWSIITFFHAVDLSQVRVRQSDRQPPRRATAVFLLLLVLMFLVLWLSLMIPAMRDYHAPEASSIFIMDLSFVLPLLTLTAILLFKRHHLGDVLTVPLLIKTVTLGSSVLLGTLLYPAFGRELLWDEVLTYAILGLAPLLFLVPFLIRIDVNGSGDS